MPQSSLQPLCFKAELAWSKISDLEKHHLQSSNRDQSNSKNISQSNKIAIDFKSNYPCTHNYSQRLLSNNKGFSLVGVLVAASIGLVFIGVGYEIFRISHQSMVISQVVAAEQDLRAAITSALSGDDLDPDPTNENREYCAENLKHSKIGASGEISEVQRGNLVLKKGDFKQGLLIIEGITLKDEGAGIKKFTIRYNRDGESGLTITRKINYKLDSSDNVITCNIIN